MSETPPTPEQRMLKAKSNIEALRIEIREIQSENPQSFIYSDKTFKLNKVRKNLATTSKLLDEILEEM
jgi:hypothetical protein